MSAQEEIRLEEVRRRTAGWRDWGPYLSERAWGTVREDYSAEGTAWEYLPHDHARSRAYRWNEDGIAGLCDRRQFLCFSVALWNGRDPILKERLFGLTGNEGRHGEDVKEVWFYLESTPTHSYLKYLYKYPQAAFPYDELIAGNHRRSRQDREFELADTGVFDDGRYFDVFIEYAKAAPADILIRVTVVNCGPERADLDVLPTLWFRNTWSWGLDIRRPRLAAADGAVEATHFELGTFRLLSEGHPELLFTENETNYRRLFGVENPGPYTKDGINDYVVHGRTEAVNPRRIGTKAAVRYRLSLGGGETATVHLRLTNDAKATAARDDAIFQQRITEADEFYAARSPAGLGEGDRRIQRLAFAGLLWNKQFYHLDVRRWLRGDPAGAPPPAARRRGRNHEWSHLRNADILSMPDKWEYPWYAAWDLAFHTIPMALIDPDFAKEQILLLLREWYMHPNGQLPAYEWNFSDVNPPVHAWAAWRIYKIEQKSHGRRDRAFLERVFHKLLLNFTWWVNRKDAEGNNVFQGGFLGLDNIGPLDRSQVLPGGATLEQSDATSWMGMYCLNMMTIALELARENPNYEDVASKFLEHFVYIAFAMNNLAGAGLELWDRVDQFYYDVLRVPGGKPLPVRLRSMVGLIPLFAVETLESELIDTLPGFKRRMQWFIDNATGFSEHIETETTETNIRRFLSLVNRERLRRVLAVMLDESEFLSPFGIRSLSRRHREQPFHLRVDGLDHRVEYEPAESLGGLFGGNSNWRGPVWFPVNYLIIEALQKFHHFLGDGFRVECPTGSGRRMNLWEVSLDLEQRLINLFRPGPEGLRPSSGGDPILAREPHLMLFHEYFDGDTGRGLGASHQTGWTALVAKLIQQTASARKEEEYADTERHSDPEESRGRLRR